MGPDIRREDSDSFVTARIPDIDGLSQQIRRIARALDILHAPQFYVINYSGGVVQLQRPTGQVSHHAWRLFDHLCNV